MRSRVRARVSAPDGVVVDEKPSERQVIKQRIELTEGAARSKAAFLQLCRQNVNMFAEYILQDKDGGEVIQAPIHVKMHAILDRYKKGVIMAFPGCGKAVPLDTPIPVPGGFTDMGDLIVGDEVFDRRGDRCKVTMVTGVQLGRRVFEVEFDDGDVVRADAEHRWLVYTLTDLRFKRDPRVETTIEMLDAGIRRGERWRWKIPVTAPVQQPDACLPVHPYLLGLWLGDGSSTNANITYDEADVSCVERAARLDGVQISNLSRDSRNGVMNATLGQRGAGRGHPNELNTRLKLMGVMGNKHIPDRYLVASEDQRRELLAGLCDSDGHASLHASRVEFTSTNERLAMGTLELVRSLGFKGSVITGRATLDGVDHGPKWRVCFTAHEPVFRLERKQARLASDGDRTRTRHRSVVAIREVDSVPVRCITVDSSDSSYLMTRSYTVTHNTSQIAIARVLFKLGNNPNKRILLLNEVQKGGSSKTLGAIKRYIEGKVCDKAGVSRLHEVFSHLKPGDKWSETAIRIDGARGGARDWSVQAIGYQGAILGSRLSDVVIDDLLTHTTTRTQTKRNEMKRWLENSVWTRLDDGAEVAFLTNAWHKKDAAHTLGWVTLKFAVYMKNGDPAWEKEWPKERIERVREELKISALEFARAWMCQPKDPGAQIFSDKGLNRSLRNGLDRQLVEQLAIIPNRCFVVHGVDLAATKKREGACTVISSLLFHPNGDRQILRLRWGQWGAIRILQEMAQTGSSFPGSIFMVENNGVQQWMVELARENRTVLAESGGGGGELLSIFPYTTGVKKADPTLGVESMAGEMEAGGWIMPCFEERKADGSISLDPPDAIAHLIDKLEGYVATDHTPDEIMATWFAVEGGRRLINRRKSRENAGDQVTILG